MRAARVAVGGEVIFATPLLVLYGESLPNYTEGHASGFTAGGGPRAEVEDPTILATIFGSGCDACSLLARAMLARSV